MKVYIAKRVYEQYSYDDYKIIGVYATKEAAQSCCDNDVIGHGSKFFLDPKTKAGDYYDIEEHELLES